MPKYFIKPDLAVQNLYDTINELSGLTESGKQSNISLGSSTEGGGFVKINATDPKIEIGAAGETFISVSKGKLNIPSIENGKVNYNQTFTFNPESDFAGKSGDTYIYNCAGMQSAYDCTPMWFYRDGVADESAADFLNIVNESVVTTAQGKITIAFPSGGVSSARVNKSFYMMRV